MGLTNNIGTKEDIKCLKCGKSLRFDTKHPVHKDTIFWQSKDMSDRSNQWMVGDKIKIGDGGLLFTSNGNTTWTGCERCPHCMTFFYCDIIIEKGTIMQIKNIRLNETQGGSE